MVFSKRKVSLRYLLVLLYLLVVILLLCLLVRERQSDKLIFSLSQASTGPEQGSAVLSLSGESFHSGIKGVLAKNLVNEEALLWRLLVDVSVKAIDVKNDLALVACYGNKLLSIGLRDGGRPELLGSIELPGAIRQVKIVGDLALAGLQRHAGFSLVDISDPKGLKLVRNYPLSGFVTSMVVNQSTVYYTNVYQGVGRINLSAENPVPELLAPLDSPWQVDLQGTRLAVGTIGGAVHLFDIAQNGQLIEVGELKYPINVRGVAFVEDSLALVLADGTLHVYDMSSWPKLNDPAQLILSGSPMHLERVPGRATLAVGLVSGGMALVDVSQAAMPTLRSLLKLPRTFTAMKLQPEQVFGVSKVGVEVFALDKISGGADLMMATESMVELEHSKLQSWSGHVYGYRKNQLVDLGENGSTEIDSSNRFLAIVEKGDVSLFEQPVSGQTQRAGLLIPVGGARHAHLRDNYLYIVHQNGLKVLSGTRPEEFVVVGNLPLLGRPLHFEILDSGYLLISTRDNGLLVVDVNDPKQPVQVAILTPPSHLWSFSVSQDVLVDGQRAYVSQGAGGVYVVDMSSPSQPELLQIVETPGSAKQMALYDNLLLVAGGDKGLFMIDVEDRDNALFIGTLPTPLRIDSLAVVKDGLIASSHSGETMKLPLPQRMKNLQVVNQGEMRVDVEKIEKGHYAYLYDRISYRQAKVGIQ